jgi:hypothetical protein
MGSALPHLGLPSRADAYAAALEGLVQVDDLVLAHNPDLPPLYASGAVYETRPHRDWRRADQIVEEGWGDCEGLSAWRAAELRASGEDPYARVGVYHTGPRRYHAIVLRGDDTIEDPSIPLGLRWRPEMPRTRDEMNQVNGMWIEEHVPATIDVIGADVEPVGDNFTTEIVQHPKGGVAAQVKVPLADGSGSLVATSSPSENEAIAAAKAANMILGLGKKIVGDPTLAARLLPEAAYQLVLYQQPELKKYIEKAAATAANLGKQIAKGAGKVAESVVVRAANVVSSLASALKFW